MQSPSLADTALRASPMFADLSDGEREVIRSFRSVEVAVQVGEVFLDEGARNTDIFIVLQGQGVRFRNLRSGERLVVNFLFPGDVLGLHPGSGGAVTHSAAAAAPMRFCVIERAAIAALIRAHPQRAFDLAWAAALHECLLGEPASILGARDALQRMAWTLLRIFERLTAAGLKRDGRVPLPFRQRDLADLLGLSLVHTNKTIARLRLLGLADWRQGGLCVLDHAGLARLAAGDGAT